MFQKTIQATKKQVHIVELRRKLYSRGSSFETTIPMPLLFSLDFKQKHEVIFKYDSETKRWYIDFEESQPAKSTQQLRPAQQSKKNTKVKKDE